MIKNNTDKNPIIPGNLTLAQKDYTNPFSTLRDAFFKTNRKIFPAGIVIFTLTKAFLPLILHQ